MRLSRVKHLVQLIPPIPTLIFREYFLDFITKPDINLGGIKVIQKLIPRRGPFERLLEEKGIHLEEKGKTK